MSKLKGLYVIPYIDGYRMYLLDIYVRKYVLNHNLVAGVLIVYFCTAIYTITCLVINVFTKIVRE